jgi:Flp pilus assembly protein TadG
MKLFKELLKDTSGNLTTFLSIAAVPIVLAAGSAIDYVRYADAKSDLQAALDGAALSAALPTGITDAERVQIANDYFAKNFSYAQVEQPIPEVTISAATVKVEADFQLPTGLMQIAGVTTMEYQGNAEVMRPFAGAAEVVLVLDYSGSMNRKNKYQDMRDAATGMIEQLDAALPDSKLKVGIVPFSAMVYTSMSSAYVTQTSATATWTGCTQDRAYPHNINVDTPTGDSATKWGYFDNTSENTGSYSCAAYDSRDLKIIPLTNNLDVVAEQLADMRPLGNTNIQLGAEFGWNLLDPQAPYTEGAAYSDKLTRKFIVILTDGVQTSRGFGTGGVRSVANAQTNLTTLCSGMRDEGITVFTIAYDITATAVTTLLSDCAPGRYFEPDAGGTEIEAVFNEITSQITSQTVRIMK